MSNYHPEPYWSEVARKIKYRERKNVIAGDDEPYYRYKREKFLNLLEELDFTGKSILELGSGPGGNLNEVWKQKPGRLAGADISTEMIEIARKNISGEIELFKIDGKKLPFADREFDIVFSATVLQHNTDEQMLKSIMEEMCRVSKHKVFLFERIEKKITGDELCLGRPVSYYEAICNMNEFELESIKFINTRVSYYIAGASRKVLNPRTRKEGESLSKLSVLLQKLALPVSKQLDKIFISQKDIARLEFTRKS